MTRQHTLTNLDCCLGSPKLAVDSFVARWACCLLQDPSLASDSEDDLESEPALGSFKTPQEAQLDEEELRAKFAAAAAAAAAGQA